MTREPFRLGGSPVNNIKGMKSICLQPENWIFRSFTGSGTV